LSIIFSLVKLCASSRSRSRTEESCFLVDLYFTSSSSFLQRIRLLWLLPLSLRNDVESGLRKHAYHVFSGLASWGTTDGTLQIPA
jgi:hypothetical protein